MIRRPATPREEDRVEILAAPRLDVAANPPALAPWHSSVRRPSHGLAAPDNPADRSHRPNRNPVATDPAGGSRCAPDQRLPATAGESRRDRPDRSTEQAES